MLSPFFSDIPVGKNNAFTETFSVPIFKHFKFQSPYQQLKAWKLCLLVLGGRGGQPLLLGTILVGFMKVRAYNILHLF